MTKKCRNEGGFDLIGNAATRFAALSTLFDANTRLHLVKRGLAPGWQCLEVGGGNGSIASWMADQVGPTGGVVATDIDTRFLETLDCRNLEVLCHDIARDPMPERKFDLVHARMILIHLPERDAVLRRLAAVLKPEGCLVCEEFDAVSADADASIGPGEVSSKTHRAMHRLSVDRGLDRRYGRLLFGRFRALGLADVGAEATMSMVQSGSPMAMLLRASYELRRRAMIDQGYVTDDEFDADLARMEGDDFMMPSPIMWTAWGRRC
jgi:2-polyprenyl-3-methyl-5-hydroxy-6-metoxy-1,4-benzoquinol methylase